MTYKEWQPCSVQEQAAIEETATAIRSTRITGLPRTVASSGAT
jgi:hypothetical protein